MKNFDDSRVTRRSALKATGGVLGGLALGAGTASSVAAQSTVYRYDELEALLVDVDADPPAFRRVRTSLFLPEPILEDCNTDHPCSIDVLDFDSAIDDDDDDDDDDDTSGDDGGDDDDDVCPDYGAVTLLCHGATLSDTVALTGLVPDVLAQNAEDGFDFVVELTPSDETNVTDPESVSNPCPAYDDDDDDDAGGRDDGGDDQDDDDGNDGDDDSDD